MTTDIVERLNYAASWDWSWKGAGSDVKIEGRHAPLYREAAAEIVRLRKELADKTERLEASKDFAKAHAALAVKDDRAERAEAARRKVRQMVADLRALVILDEVGSNNPLGREAADLIERLSSRVAVDVPEGLLRETIVRVHREAKQASSWSVGSAEYFDAMTKAIADALSASPSVNSLSQRTS